MNAPQPREFSWDVFDAQPTAVKALVWEMLEYVPWLVPAELADVVSAKVRRDARNREKANARRSRKRRDDFARFVPRRA